MRMRDGPTGDRAAWQLWCGRLAMGAMAVLALHADVQDGLLHDFLETSADVPYTEINGAATTLAAPRPPDADGDLEADSLNVAFAASLASDVMLQDIPIDLDRGLMRK